MVPHSPKEMVQPHLARRADVHRGAQAHGLQAAENFDRLRVVLVAALRRANHIFFVAHFFSWRSNFSRVPAALDRLRTTRSAHPRSKLVLCEARKACLRNDPYVAYPLISVRRANPKLVGFLLHPISRSETWRRLMFLQVSGPELLARSPISGSHLQIGRVDLKET